MPMVEPQSIKVRTLSDINKNELKTVFSVIGDPSVPGFTVNTGLLFIQSRVSHSEKFIFACEKLSLFEDASFLLKIRANNKELL